MRGCRECEKRGALVRGMEYKKLDSGCDLFLLFIYTLSAMLDDEHALFQFFSPRGRYII
jgi:hypothetical protein